MGCLRYSTRRGRYLVGLELQSRRDSVGIWAASHDSPSKKFHALFPLRVVAQMWRLQNGRAASAAFTTRLASCVASSLGSGSATLAATPPGATSSSTSCAQGTIRCVRGMQPNPVAYRLRCKVDSCRRVFRVHLSNLSGLGKRWFNQPFDLHHLAGACVEDYTAPFSAQQEN